MNNRGRSLRISSRNSRNVPEFVDSTIFIRSSSWDIAPNILTDSLEKLALACSRPPISLHP